ncbi:hypothetical protein OOJ09_25985 [Mesorhizobium qingshengii]|uniref:Immunity protein 8 n=1 Tax=Mesorhizobium qingshengii TaxID=1165689 RepID=A0ABT4R1N1_9HYPH|nr:hypothetical protein [Mesorhizobium qingshengii]MCZ8547651.1 hypothetical protein [Mesorhizobium qingshengii]
MSNDLEVRFYARHEDGGFESLITYSAKHFDGVIPSCGDTVILDEHQWGRRYFIVTRRHFLTELSAAKGWALMVEQLDEDHDLKEIAYQWDHETKFFNEARDERRAAPD